jgi:hypothetical protein
MRRLMRYEKEQCHEPFLNQDCTASRDYQPRPPSSKTPSTFSRQGALAYAAEISGTQ